MTSSTHGAARSSCRPAYDDPAHPVGDAIFRSGGTTAAYLLLTDAGRVIVNTGLGFEAPHHKRVFDAVRPGPTHFIVTTQAHVDHVGGVDLFKEPDTVYVAQANNRACQADDARIRDLRMRTGGHLVRHAGHRCPPHRVGESRRADAPGRAGARHDLRRPTRTRTSTACTSS